MNEHWTERWWVIGLLGLFMVLGGVHMWCEIAAWEANPAGKPNPINAPGGCLAVVPNILYWIGGKWLVSGGILLMGVVLLVHAYDRWRRPLRYFASPYRSDRWHPPRDVDDEEPIRRPFESVALTSRDDFILNVLGRVPLDPLPVQVKALKHVLPAILSLEITNFEGEVSDVMLMLDFHLSNRFTDEDALWAMVYLAQHVGESFNYQDWTHLLRINLDYAGYAVEMAYLAHDRHGWPYGPGVVAILSHMRAWDNAAAHVDRLASDFPELQDWWRLYVLPIHVAVQSQPLHDRT